MRRSTRTLLLTLAPAVILTACGEIDVSSAPGNVLPDDAPPGDAPSADVADDPQEVCATQAVWFDPDGSRDGVRVDSRVRVGLQPPLPADQEDWSLQVIGVEGTARISEDRATLTFEPARPLEHDRAYEIVATVCDEQATRTFSTLPPPVPLDALEGRTWLLDLTAMAWVEPASAASFVQDLGLDTLVLRARRAGPELELVGRLAIDIGGVPFPLPCSPPMTFGRIDLTDNPRFVVHPIDLDASWLGVEAHLAGLRIDGRFASDGTRITEVQAVATLDTRSVDELVGSGTVCELSQRIGETCEPCDDGEPACLPAFLTGGSALAGASMDLFTLGVDLLGLCP